MPNSKTGIGAFLKDEIEIVIKGNKAQVHRKGWRSTLDCTPSERDLPRYLGGKIPYFYRDSEKIAADFAARHDALDIVVDLATKAPTSENFQQSHCGEIMTALYLEDVLKLRMLYSKLTLTTSENTNVHKMDGFFVDTTTDPFTFYAVEAKTSILPTPKTPFQGHRYGILKSMIDSLEKYGADDKRFDFTLIRDNLSQASFSPEEAKKIKKDLIPPGPAQLVNLGMAAVNESTIVGLDDEYILTEKCALSFNFRSLVVVDLAKLSKKAYGHVAKFKTLKK
jgi:hypothetical protein